MRLSNISNLKRSITSGLSSSYMMGSQKSQQETFLTLQQRSMSQISNDSSYPTEFRKATEQYIYANDRLKDSQQKKAQEAEHLKYKQQLLEQQAAELQRMNNEIGYMKIKQKQQIATIQVEIQEKEENLRQIMSQVSKDIDVCACLSSLQQVIHQRLQNYKTYAQFCQQVHDQLISNNGAQTTESNTHSGYFVNKLDSLLETNRFLNKTLETVKFQKWYQEQQENKIDAEESATKLGMEKGANDIFAVASANQGAFSMLRNELQRQEQENAKLRNQEEITRQQLQQLTEQLNASFEAVNLLYKRVEPLLEGRHRALGDRATPADLLGGRAEKLNAAAETIVRRAGGLIGEAEAQKKVFPTDLEGALRKLFKLKLFLDDQEQVLQLYEKQYGVIPNK